MYCVYVLKLDGQLGHFLATFVSVMNSHCGHISQVVRN